MIFKVSQNIPCLQKSNEKLVKLSTASDESDIDIIIVQDHTLWMEGKLAQGRVHVYYVYLCTCVRVCLFPGVCIHKVGRSLDYTTVFPRRTCPSDKRMFFYAIRTFVQRYTVAVLGLRNIADCVRSVATVWQSYTWGDQLDCARKFDPVSAQHKLLRARDTQFISKYIA